MRNYSVKMLDSREKARCVTKFLLSEYAFENGALTPGEIGQIKVNPAKSLNDPGFRYWYAESSEGEIISAIGVRENEHKTGGYTGDYFAVHKNYRHAGIASEMLDVMISHVEVQKGRYLIIDTSEKDSYSAIRHLLEEKGFLLVGYLPEYYNKGEGTVLYYKGINSSVPWKVRMDSIKILFSKYVELR